MKNSIKKICRFIFFGTGDFAVGILDKLIENGYLPEIVVTSPDKPQGRKMTLTPSPIKERVMNNELGIIDGITILQPEKLEKSLFTIPNSLFDLFIVADYGKIIPKEILEIPRYGVINVHPSLLPKFRGPSPIQSFILSNEKETGVTIMLMDEKVDHGDIVASKELKVKSTKYKDLEQELANVGGKLLVETIPDWLDGKIKPKKQDHAKATFTKKTTKDDGLIDLEKDSPKIIYNKFCAFTPWPGVYFSIDNKRIIVTEAEMNDNHLSIKKIKPEGKKEMLLSNFLRGNRLTTDSQLRSYL